MDVLMVYILYKSQRKLSKKSIKRDIYKMNIQGMGNVVNRPWPVSQCDVADGRVTRCLKD